MDGMDVGLVGVKFGVSVVGEVLKGIFSGDSEGIEKWINVEVEKIEVQVKCICNCMLVMLVSQQVLVVLLFVFKFYVMMDQSDVDDCGKDIVVQCQVCDRLVYLVGSGVLLLVVMC